MSSFFDTDNKIIQLCAQGMELEGLNQHRQAHALFVQAWDEAITDLEKFTAAHYVARNQPTVMEKLKWDERALNLALGINDASIQSYLPSLYLNIAKCYEDLSDLAKAKNHYEMALSYAEKLGEDGYGKLIRSGILKGIERVTKYR